MVLFKVCNQGVQWLSAPRAETRQAVRPLIDSPRLWKSLASAAWGGGGMPLAGLSIVDGLEQTEPVGFRAG